eukprot:354212-Chlamydomonas_euryale.AAC.23
MALCPRGAWAWGKVALSLNLQRRCYSGAWNKKNRTCACCVWLGAIRLASPGRSHKVTQCHTPLGELAFTEPCRGSSSTWWTRGSASCSGLLMRRSRHLVLPPLAVKPTACTPTINLSRVCVP